MNKPIKELSYAAFSATILGISSPVSTNAETTAVSPQFTSDHFVIKEMISDRINRGKIYSHSDGHGDHSDHVDKYTDDAKNYNKFKSFEEIRQPVIRPSEHQFNNFIKQRVK